MVLFLTVVFVVSAVILTVIILLQDDQGEGVGGLFGGGSGSAFGPRTGNVLTKFTSIVAAIFLLSAFGVAWLNRTGTSEDIEAKAKAKMLEEEGSSSWYIRAEQVDQGKPESVEDETGSISEEPGSEEEPGALKESDTAEKSDTTEESPEASQGEETSPKEKSTP